MAIIRYAKMNEMRLELSFDAGLTWLTCGEGIENIDAPITDETVERSYMNTQGGKVTIKTGTSRGFKVTGDRAVGDALQDKILGFEFIYADDRSCQYRYYDSVTKKGEKGNANIVINNDGSGDANSMKIEFSVNVTGVPTAYTHTP